MISEIRKAIYDKYNSNAELKSLLSGGLWYQLAPTEITGEYGVFTIASMGFDEIMGSPDNSVKNAIVYFNVYSHGLNNTTDIENVAEKVRDVFNWKTLLIAGRSFVSCNVDAIEEVTKDNEYQQTLLVLNISYV